MKEYKTVANIRIGDTDPVPWDSLTEDQKRTARKSMSENISRRLSDLYTQRYYDQQEKLACG